MKPKHFFKEIHRAAIWNVTFEIVLQNKSNSFYATFSILTVKEAINIDKDDNKSVVTLSYKKKFSDSARFMPTW